ncbi:MAG: transcriptional repressor [Bacteroides sp.]|nr:transcriptional repressor [Bacteroides sp.]
MAQCLTCMHNDQTTETHEKATEKFTAFLTSRHLRKTPERFEILKSVVECNEHFDADSLHKMLDEKGYHVSRATVYNTIELLCGAGIVRKLLFDTHQARYELAEKTHCHLVCTQCGEIREIDLDEIDKKLSAVSLRGFSPAYVSTCIYGICESCQNK